MNPFVVFLMIQAAMVAAYFSLVYFWVYPDSEYHLQNPRDWALSGGLLTLMFNFPGLALWLILYVDGRRRGPGFSLMHSKPVFKTQGYSSRYYLIL